MLLASTPAAPRSLHREDHMREPNENRDHQYQSTTFVQQQHNDACLSVPEDVEVEQYAEDSERTLLRPRATGTPNDPQLGRVIKPASATNLSRSSVDGGISSKDDEETQTTETPKIRFLTSSSSSGSSDNAVSSQVSSSASATRVASVDPPSSSTSKEEDDRDCSKKGEEENDQGSHSPRRQSPSPSFPLSGSLSLTSISSSPTKATRPMKSALKSPGEGSKKKTKGRNYRTRRLVRGLWNDDSNCHFSQLHDETLLKIMAYLNMKDVCVTTMVCQRWKLLSLHPNSWKRIDATDFVAQAHAFYISKEKLPQAKATKHTSLALAKRMERHAPQSLSIHSIEHRLSADNFLSSLPGLQELTLASFAELTDTHMHVLLLSSSCNKNGVHAANRSKGACVLRKLVLENCPRLTDATVQSIGKMCPELEELSLAGNPNIKDISALQDLWTLCHNTVPKKPAPSPLTSLFPSVAPPPPPQTTMKTPAPSNPPTTSQVSTNLSSLFGGPSPPSRPSTPPSSSTLSSLFAPPGQSPVRRHPIATLPRPLSKGKDQKLPGKLTRLNISNTSVTAEGLLKAMKLAAFGGSSTIRLEHLVMRGSGDSWNNERLKELAQELNVAKLQVLDISCSPSFPDAETTSSTANSAVTDEGLQPLIAQATSLKELHIAGHAGLALETLANQAFMSLSALRTLNLEGCKGLSLMSDNPMNDFQRVSRLAKALRYLTAHGNLRRLSLARCFSNQEELRNNPELLAHEECLGQELIKALTDGEKSKATNKKGNSSNSSVCIISNNTGENTLRELDWRDCWFLTTQDVMQLRKHCPGIETFHLVRTRAAASAILNDNMSDG